MARMGLIRTICWQQWQGLSFVSIDVDHGKGKPRLRHHSCELTVAIEREFMPEQRQGGQPVVPGSDPIHGLQTGLQICKFKLCICRVCQEAKKTWLFHGVNQQNLTYTQCKRELANMEQPK